MTGYCTEHEESFAIGTNCPKCDTSVTPETPMEGFAVGVHATLMVLQANDALDFGTEGECQCTDSDTGVKSCGATTCEDPTCPTHRDRSVEFGETTVTDDEIRVKTVENPVEALFIGTPRVEGSWFHEQYEGDSDVEHPFEITKENESDIRRMLDIMFPCDPDDLDREERLYGGAETSETDVVTGE